ncbi:hypothetical protein HMPREF0202_02793, partial [Cetobacterium somerae ATCC BAA-474]
KEQLTIIKKEVTKVIEKQYKLYTAIINKIKIDAKISIKTYEELQGKELRFIENYYNELLFPILIPMEIDTFRPFPHL